MGIIAKARWDDFALVYNDRKNYPSLTAVAKKLDINLRSVTHTATTIKASDDGPLLINRSDTAAKIEPEGKEHRDIETVLPESEEPIHELLARAIEHNERVAGYHGAKNCIDISIKVDGPFGVVGLPDHHLNNVGTLLRRAFDDAHIIANHEALYAVGIGDWLDNFIMGRLERERRKDIMSHSDSWRLLEYYVEILAGKLIAAISGNHMDWSAELGGVDLLARMFKEKGLGAIYDADQVRVRLNCPNGRSFTHLARHKYRGHSKYNAVHAILVWMLENWQGEDVVWGGHIHTAGHTSIEKTWMGERRVVHGVQLAAYKDIDGYATREAFRRNVPFLVPMVIHIPETGETLFFDDMRRGVEVLDSLRR